MLYGETQHVDVNDDGTVADIPRHVPRYIPWSVPDFAPPLPPKKSTAPVAVPTEASGMMPTINAELDAGNNDQSVPPAVSSVSGSNIDPGLIGTGGTSIKPNFKQPGELRAAAGPVGAIDDAKAIQDAVMDPSNWLLRNRETGQEVEATAFAEALAAHRPQQAWYAGSPPWAPSNARWISRRHRYAGPIPRRPTLLPPNSGSMNDFSLLSFPSRPLSPRSLLASSVERGSSVEARSRSPPSEHPRPGVLNGNSSHRRNPEGSGSTIVSNSDSDALGFQVRKMRTAQTVPQLHPGGIRAICFSPLGELLATAGADHRCCVFRVKLRHRTALEEYSPNAPAAALAADVGPSTWQIADAMALSLVDDEPMRVLSGHVGEVVSLSWAPDDSVLLTASADGTVRSWNPRDGDECLGLYEHGGGVTSVSWEPTSVSVPGGKQEEGASAGGRFLTGCLDGKLRLFSLGSPEAEESVLTERPVTAVAFSPGGKGLVAGFVGGNVGFYRTDGIVKELTAECRRHGIRHTASQHARLATSPVKRLSSSNSGRASSRSSAHSRRRRSTVETSAGARRSESGGGGRVTGLCFRPQGKGRAASEREQRLSGSSDAFGRDATNSAVPSSEGLYDDLALNRAPVANIEEEQIAVEAQVDNDKDSEACAWVGPMADLLVSTNDSRSRVLVSEGAGRVVVGAKLKGHKTDGMLGRRISAQYSDDGELVISGSTDGNIHVWSTPTAAFANHTSNRVVTWLGGRKGHEHVQVCAKTVAVPVALFAPSSIGEPPGRVILTGDDEGCLKVFMG